MEHDFSIEKYQKFMKSTEIPMDLDRIDLLENLKALRNGRMTNAGALLFCTKASDFLISATITCVLFQGNTKTRILDQKFFDGDLLSNYQGAISYLLSHLNTEYIIKLERVERLELPEKALREAVLNAMAHRDYRSRADIQVYIFKDRVEIVNPGGLVAGMRLEDLGKRSLPRNPLLFSLMHRMHLVERVGSGFKRMRQSLMGYGLSGPFVEADDHGFSLCFPRPDASSALETRKKTRKKTHEIILSIIERNPHVTLEQLAKSTGLSFKGIEWNVNILKEAGLLKRIGPDKGGYWQVIERED